MGGEFEVDPVSLRSAANRLEDHAAAVASQSETLSVNTAGRVGRGAIGEAIEDVVKRGMRLVADDMAAAVRRFYNDAAVVMRRTADETKRTDGEAGTAFDSIGRRAAPEQEWGMRTVGNPVDRSSLSGPWAEEAARVEVGGAVPQSRPRSCVAACGEMLTGGSLSEAAFLDQFGEDSNPEALANALNAREAGAGWRGGYFLDESWAVAAARRGPMAAVLQAPLGGAHMVVIEPAGEGEFLVRDPAPGVTYRVTPAWIEKYVSGGVFR
jgi:hypothetical protein